MLNFTEKKLKQYHCSTALAVHSFLESAFVFWWTFCTLLHSYSGGSGGSFVHCYIVLWCWWWWCWIFVHWCWWLCWCWWRWIFCTLLHSSVGVGGGGGQFKARVEGNYMCSPPPGSDSWRFAQVFLQNYFLSNLHSKRANLSFTLDEN